MLFSLTTSLGEPFDTLPLPKKVSSCEFVTLDEDYEHDIVLKLKQLISRTLHAVNLIRPSMTELLTYGSGLDTYYLQPVPSLAAFNVTSDKIKFNFKIPLTYKAAMKSLQAPHWIKACND